MAKRTPTPSPQVLQRVTKAVLSGKCKLSRPTYLKLKRHRNILRRLAALKGTTKSKKAFVTQNRKQIGGLLPILPLVISALGGLAGSLIKR